MVTYGGYYRHQLGRVATGAPRQDDLPNIVAVKRRT